MLERQNHKRFGKLKSMNVLFTFLNILIIQYEQKIMDPRVIKTLK